MIYVSTGGERQKSGLEAALYFREAGIDAVELSGGKPDALQSDKLKLLSREMELQVHNYFPPPAEPFVLNLASSDTVVAQKSIDHVKRGIDLAMSMQKPVYSVHAGFLFDPNPALLGKGIPKTELASREESLVKFSTRVESIADEYSGEGFTILIENNVLSKKNLENFLTNPFLLVEAEECVAFVKCMPANVRLLIDVAHVKVSAASLGFDGAAMLNECAPWTYAYHLSDNDGISDSNGIVTTESWFWPYLKKGVHFHVLEVYNIPPHELLQQIQIVKQHL